TGWELNVMDEAQASEKSESEAKGYMDSFMEQLDVDEDVAAILVQEGFTSVDEVAYVPIEEMHSVEEFDEELVEELRNRAKDFLLTRAIANEEAFREPAEDLLSMDGMDQQLAFTLAGRGVVTMEDLAEQSIDELMEIDGMDEERAGQLIMTARAPWFEEAE
ncbi:MAG: helix-hairpin-helix domain-containing protein, partial [Candidatus Thiodiazotropha endolucinida]|nr:helix-hairpin-helix domain-containing protein [Candidatus Thiodiazotropha taylori]MCW4322769.1 helix-hairpin-helix domain-containing protein [Candidatus Thiodiazotropha taylori]